MEEIGLAKDGAVVLLFLVPPYNVLALAPLQRNLGVLERVDQRFVTFRIILILHVGVLMENELTVRIVIVIKGSVSYVKVEVNSVLARDSVEQINGWLGVLISKLLNSGGNLIF